MKSVAVATSEDSEMKKSFKRAATALFVVMFGFAQFNSNARAEEPGNSGRMVVVVVGESDNLADEAAAVTEVVIASIGVARAEPGFKLNAPLPSVMVGSEEVMKTLSAGDQRMASCVSKTECLAQACRVHNVSWAVVGTIVHRGDEKTGEFIISLSLFDAVTKEFVLTRPFQTTDLERRALSSLNDEVRLLLQQPVVGQRTAPKSAPTPPPRVNVAATAATAPPPAKVSPFGGDINLGLGYGFIQVGVGGSYRMKDSWRLRAEALFHKSILEPVSPWPLAEAGMRLGADYEFSAWRATAGCEIGPNYLFADVEPGFALAASCGGGWTASVFGRRIVVGMRPEAVMNGGYKSIRFPLSMEMGLVEEVAR